MLPQLNGIMLYHTDVYDITHLNSLEWCLWCICFPGLNLDSLLNELVSELPILHLRCRPIGNCPGPNPFPCAKCELITWAPVFTLVWRSWNLNSRSLYCCLDNDTSCEVKRSPAGWGCSVSWDSIVRKVSSISKDRLLPLSLSLTLFRLAPETEILFLRYSISELYLKVIILFSIMKNNDNFAGDNLSCSIQNPCKWHCEVKNFTKTDILT